jgi:hypothetical protein
MAPRDHARRPVHQPSVKISRTGDAKKRLARLVKTAEANQLGAVFAVRSFGPVLASMTIEEPV